VQELRHDHPQVLFLVLALGDVDIDARVAPGPAVGVARDPSAAEDPADLARRADDAVFGVVSIGAAGDGLTKAPFDAIAIVRMAILPRQRLRHRSLDGRDAEQPEELRGRL
jgi:hypothetical protein